MGMALDELKSKLKPTKKETDGPTAEQKEKEKQLSKQEKEKAKWEKRRQKEMDRQKKIDEKKDKRVRKRANKRNRKQSAYEDQRSLKDKTLSDPRLDRLARDPTIWEKMAEDSMYDMLRDMGNDDKAIDGYQRNRLLQSIFIGVIVFGVGWYMDQALLMGLGPILSIMIYIMRYSSVKKMYAQWKFEREMAFSRFIRLLIPYLKQSGGNVSLYTTFNKMLERMDDEADQRSLYMLMGEMSSRPGDQRPFLDFAERSSGSDQSYLIMSTIFDFQQSTQDTSVIDELGQMASKKMMNGIDEIIAAKIKRFGMFPTKVVMSSFILVIGFAASVLLQNVMNLFNQTGGMGGLF